jgi:tetratricopeptide (TPR) repeat protein
MWRICWILVLGPALTMQANPQTWTKPIEELIASGKLTEASARLDQEKATRGETARELYLEARILFEQKRYSDALQTVQRSIVLTPSDAESMKLAALSAIRLDQLNIAETALKSAAQLTPNDYLVHFHLGALYYTKSLFLAARPELQKAVELNGEYMPALLFLGLTLEEVGDSASTIETYRRAISVTEKQHSRADAPYTSLGKYFYRLNRFEESLPLLRAAVEINSHSGEAWLVLGKALRALGQDGAAAGALNRAVAADAQNPEPHYVLFRIYESTGRSPEAEEELKAFQRLKPKPAEDARRGRIETAGHQ